MKNISVIYNVPSLPELVESMCCGITSPPKGAPAPGASRLLSILQKLGG